MAYGVTRFDPKHGLPTIEVRVVGKDRKWRTIEKECRFIIDSGSNLTFIESRHLKGMKIEYLGSVIGQTASGTVAQNVFSGPILQFRGINDKGERMEFSCEEPFVIQSPALLGGSAFKSTGVCVSLDYRKKTVRITRGKPRSITSKY